MSDAAAAAGASIEELISSYQERRISRRRLLSALGAAGASAAVAAALLNAAENATPPGQSTVTAAGSHHRTPAALALDLKQAHAQHISAQVAGTTAATPRERAAAVAKMLSDYSPNAVVNDPLFGQPLVGSAAIAVHKTAEMAAISEVSFNLLSQTVVGSQTIASWEMKARHSGPYYNLPATGKEIGISGLTVHTRGQDGKILVETLYYDAAAMAKQLTER